MTYAMPTINLSAVADLTADELALAKQVVKSSGKLYASKPKQAQGDAQYLWRELVFTLSANPKHQCLPVMSEFDIEVEDWDARRARAKELDDLAKRIADTVPLTEHHGTMRWGRAFGII